MLSSTKVFQSAFVPGLTSIYSRTSPSLERKAQAGFDNSSQFSISSFTSINSLRLFVLTLVFLQVGFVTVLVVAAWFRVDKVAFGFFKNHFKVCCSYFFSVFCCLVFCCCAVGQWLKRLLFSPASARTFFVNRFHFIPQGKAVLFFTGCLPVDGWQFTFFSCNF